MRRSCCRAFIKGRPLCSWQSHCTLLIGVPYRTLPALWRANTKIFDLMTKELSMIQTSVDSTIRTGAPRSAEQSMRNSMQLLRIIHSVMQQQSLRSLSVVFPSSACQLK